MANRYWRAVDAERVLATWRRSGRTAAAFAREHGLSTARLLRWRARLEPSAPPVFHPVRVVGRERPSTTARPEPLELELRGGRRIRVPAGFDPALLAELVRTVEGWGC
ncbi:MAG: IS66 family insertion sequence element accessory protein TnpB [Candidatus Eisenbacteria bacterium]|nr:IS66 family insertion sequence element accessory protein TnpB [Candidatus Eisenbacteria bacterium]